MDFANIMSLVTVLSQGGPAAVIAILVMVIAALMLDRRRLVSDITKRDEKLDKIVDDYYRGNLTLSEALNSLKSVLFEIKSKF